MQNFRVSEILIFENLGLFVGSDIQNKYLVGEAIMIAIKTRAVICTPKDAFIRNIKCAGRNEGSLTHFKRQDSSGGS